jgi:hypothetical protein
VSSVFAHRHDLLRVFVLGCASAACEPELVVGKRIVTQPLDCEPTQGVGGAGALDKVIEVPWSTGFEDEFCAYRRAGGFCPNDNGAEIAIVDDPVHTGQSAAAYSITAEGRQSRCFLEGTLPEDAVYTAWFYLPRHHSDIVNWNLVHFQGGPMPFMLRNLWDVSVENADDGTLRLYVRDFLHTDDTRGVPLRPDAAPAVPIASWFEIKFRLRRAADATGRIALYQDGELLLERTDITTDPTEFGQWYAGNFVGSFTPSDSTIYVDDVSTSAP